MRRSQAFALSLLLAAAPAAAQQTATLADQTEPTAPAAPATPAPVQAAAPVQAPLAQPTHDARLDVDRDQARKSFDARGQRSDNVLAGHPWWWLVAAVAAGIVIAAVITS